MTQYNFTNGDKYAICTELDIICDCYPEQVIGKTPEQIVEYFKSREYYEWAKADDIANGMAEEYENGNYPYEEHVALCDSCIDTLMKVAKSNYPYLCKLAS